MDKLFSIGEVAKINEISIDRLRNYDKIGLLVPSYIDPKTNYRYYSEDQFRKLRFIKYLRKIGIPLKEIDLILNKNTDSKEFTDFLNNKINYIEKEIESLKIIKEDILELKSSLEHNLKISNINYIYKKNFEERYVFKKKIDRTINFVVSHREQVFSEFKMEINKIIPSRSFEKGIYIKNLDDRNKDSSEVYFLLKDYKKLHNFVIPKGKYLCLSYQEDERNNAICELKNYIEKNNITIKGPILNVVLSTLPKEYFQFQILID
ncbi:MerR family transcriptional regulator [Clostridium perfringens]|nr:MerR family transcriptional regulator [Clostridium perfringens]